MLSGLYARWMYAWETALTTRDENRVERPLEWGFDHLADVCGTEAAARVARGEATPADAMAALNRHLVANPEQTFGYATPTDFRLEHRHPELFPTNVRPETLSQAAEYRRRAQAGELRRAPFLRFTSAVRTHYPANDQVNARWYEASVRPTQNASPQPDPAPTQNASSRPEATQNASSRPEATQKASSRPEATQKASSRPEAVGRSGETPVLRGARAGGTSQPRQAMIVLPQWNADAFSHNALCEIFLRWGISSLRLSKPYHDIRRPAELERSDYAVSANIGRTIQAARQAVADIRSCCDWLEAQGYTQIGVLGTSLGSCYAYLAAAMDPRLQVCAFNHASTSFGDVVWEGQSTRHIHSAFEHAGLDQKTVRRLFAAISPNSYVDRYAATGRAVDRHSLVVYATYDLTFPREGSLASVQGFRDHDIPHVARVLPCGHYTTGEFPYKYLDGWYLGHFIWKQFKRLRASGNQGPSI